MNPHLKHVPCLRTFTTGCLPGCDLESLRGEAHGTLNAQILRLRTLEQLRAHLFEGGDFAARQGDADFVDFLEGALSVAASKGRGALHTGPSPSWPNFSGLL